MPATNSPKLSATTRYALRRLWSKAKRALAVVSTLVLGAATVILWSTPLGRSLDVQTLRAFHTIRGDRSAPALISLVALDDETFRTFNIQAGDPLPRARFADAIERIVAAKPRALIIDANFPHETFDPAANERIARAMAAVPTSIGAGKMNTGLANNPFVTIPSDELFRKAARFELPMMFNVLDSVVSLIGFSDKRGQPPLSQDERVPLARILKEAAGVPVGTPGSLELINFYGPPGTIPRVSLSSVTDPSAQNLFTDKVVFIGYQTLSKPGSRELDKEEFWNTGSWQPMFGVELHATIAANLIDGSWLKRLSLDNEVLGLFAIGSTLGAFGVFAPPITVAIVALSTFAVLLLAAFIAFSFGKLWLPGLLTIGLIGLITWLGSVIINLARLGHLQRFIRRVFRAQAN